MNMMHIMHNHNTPGTVCTLTGMDVVIMIVGFILLIGSGVKVTEWLLDKTYHMKDLWGSIVCIVGMFSYVIIWVIVIGLLMYLI
jgi:hypothetical protein